MILRGLVRALVFIWAVMAVLIGAAVGVGHLLPDGDEMTYANILDSKHSSSINVFIRDMSRGLAQQLTYDHGTNALAKWSPDGKQISYLSFNGRVFHVYLMDAAGRNKRQLGIEFTEFDSPYIWSPDSQWILFSVNNQGVPKSLIVNTGTSEQYEIPQTSREWIWSPDSQNIISQPPSNDGTMQLYGMNIGCFAQSSPCQFSELDFLDDSANEIRPRWSPDGKSLAFTQYGYDRSKLMVATLRCAELKANCIINRRTIDDNSYGAIPIWSADSQRLAYPTIHSEIRVVEVESGDSRTYNLAGTPAIQNWSPDGYFITYFTNQTGNTTLYILDTWSGETHPLFQYQVVAISPSWRPLPR